MEQIGIQPYALITQVINFTIMVVLLTKLLYKPILKAIDDRRKKIEEGLKAAEKSQKELELTEKKRQDILDKARDEAKKIIEEGKKVGKKTEAEITEKAHQEARAILEKGRKDIEVEREQMEKKLKSQTVEIAGSIAEKVIRDVLSATDQEAIIDKKIKEIAKLADKAR